MKKKKIPMWFEEPNELPTEKHMNDFLKKIWERPMRLGMKIPGMSRIRNFPTDMQETKDSILIKADLPGFRKEDVKLKVTPLTVSILAQKKSETHERTENMYRQERMSGALSRSFRLPFEINPKDVKAKMENGVLAIVLPKIKKEKAKR